MSTPIRDLDTRRLLPGEGEEKETISQNYSAWLAYRNQGGLLNLTAWVDANKPAPPQQPPVQPPPPPPTEPPVQPLVLPPPTDDEEGEEPFIPPPLPPEPIEEEDIDEPFVPPPEAEEGDDFSQQLADVVAAWQQEQRELGERMQAEAGRRGARGIGKLSYEQRQALLARGYTPAEIEQLTAGGVEAGFRSIYDIQKELGLETQRMVAEGAQWGIGTMITGEQLEQRQREMAQRGGEFQQSLAEQMRQFNLGLKQQKYEFKESQPGFWDYLVSAIPDISVSV